MEINTLHQSPRLTQLLCDFFPQTKLLRSICPDFAQEPPIVPPDNVVPPDSGALIKPLKRLLRPLVRLALMSGITFPVLADLLRSLFVDVALNDMLQDPAAKTDSRISLLTGIYRKEIHRLRQEESFEESVPEVVTTGSQVIGRWLGSPAYTNKAGRPRDLPRQRPAGGGISFETLVESVTTDIRPRAVLDDFVSHGLVTLESGGLVRLNRAAFIPAQGRAEQLYFFARNLHDHAAAGVANIITRDGRVFLDSSVHYDQLDTQTAARLEALALEVGTRVLLEINRAALDMTGSEQTGAAQEPVAGQQLRRVNFGVYLYSCDDKPAGEDEV